jgi:hypothetical protein
MATVSDKKSKKLLRAAVPPHIRALFGPRPLLRTEDVEAYDRLLSELALEIEPSGITEWLWVRDLADLNWEMMRIRRAIASLLNVEFKRALYETLKRVAQPQRTYTTFQTNGLRGRTLTRGSSPGGRSSKFCSGTSSCRIRWWGRPLRSAFRSSKRANALLFRTPARPHLA